MTVANCSYIMFSTMGGHRSSTLKEQGYEKKFPAYWIE